jgi:hypothetical protein
MKFFSLLLCMVFVLSCGGEPWSVRSKNTPQYPLTWTQVNQLKEQGKDVPKPALFTGARQPSPERDIAKRRDIAKSKVTMMYRQLTDDDSAVKAAPSMRPQLSTTGAMTPMRAELSAMRTAPAMKLQPLPPPARKFQPFSFIQANGSTQAIAILEIKNKAPRKVTKDEIEYLTNLIRSSLSSLPKQHFLVMTKENIETMIPQGKSIEDCMGSCEVETGRLLNAHWIITGEMIKFGKSMRITVKLHNSQSGNFVGSSSAKGSDIEDFEQSIQKLALDLLYKMLPKLKDHLDQYLTPSISDRINCLQSQYCTSNK